MAPPAASSLYHIHHSPLSPPRISAAAVAGVLCFRIAKLSVSTSFQSIVSRDSDCPNFWQRTRRVAAGRHRKIESHAAPLPIRWSLRLAAHSFRRPSSSAFGAGVWQLIPPAITHAGGPLLQTHSVNAAVDDPRMTQGGRGCVAVGSCVCGAGALLEEWWEGKAALGAAGRLRARMPRAIGRSRVRRKAALLSSTNTRAHQWVALGQSNVIKLLF